MAAYPGPTGPADPSEAEIGRLAAEAIDVIHISKLAAERARAATLTPRDALAVLQFECHVIRITLADWDATGEVSDAEWDRFDEALRRVELISTEALK